MIGVKANKSNSRERSKSRRRLLRVERLSDRVMLDGAGLGIADPLPWFDPAALTYSFAPDGTNLAGQQSRLFAELAQLGEPAEWQQEFDDAFNAWLQPLGVRIGQVTDLGSEFGVAGPAQGDARFGDVRIAAVPLSSGTMATSVPHSVIVQGTWAGDIFINSDVEWHNLQEVFSVALHEMGHVLGLGHSQDPLSPMFVHGVYNVSGPTADDILDLKTLYAGIRFEDPSDPADDHDVTETPIGSETVTSGTIDLSQAVTLLPAIGSTVRYASQGSFSDVSSSVVFKLEPPMGDVQDLENLNVVLRSTGSTILDADIQIVDQHGRATETRVLHHNQGNVVVQTSGVNSNHSYYVQIKPSAGSPQLLSGDFEVVMDFSQEVRVSEQIGEIEFDSEHTAFEQSLSVSSSRLVHIRLDSHAKLDLDTTLRVAVVDADHNVLARLALHPGMTRSAPLTFLPAGTYRLLFEETSRAAKLGENQFEVFVDEVSLDVGPGVSDPTETPYVTCSEPGTEPAYCYEYIPVVASPPTESTTQPWYDPNDPWWYDVYSCSDYQAAELNDAQNVDPNWWSFYLETCQATDPIPTDPILTDPIPTDPTPTDPIPTDPPQPPQPPVVSAWQNTVEPLDVSGDLVISAVDALMVINYMNRSGNGVHVGLTADLSIGFVDVDGDLEVSPFDVLLIINEMNKITRINRMAFSAAEYNQRDQDNLAMLL